MIVIVRRSSLGRISLVMISRNRLPKTRAHNLLRRTARRSSNNNSSSSARNPNRRPKKRSARTSKTNRNRNKYVATMKKRRPNPGAFFNPIYSLNYFSSAGAGYSGSFSLF